MTLKTDLVAFLKADSELSTLLTGGWYVAEDMDIHDFSLDDAPKRSDEVRIAPHGVIRFKGMPRYGPRKLDAERGSVELYVYDDKEYGFASIDPAITRIKELLTRKFFWNTSDRYLAHFDWPYPGPESRAEEYGGSAMQFIRFTLTQTRR